MATTSPVAIVDAVMADLVANAGLPVGQPASQRKYAEPTVIVPGACPLLAVWCEETEYQLLTTGGAYERVHRVNVGWYVVNAQGAETGGTGDPAVVEALDQTIETLLAQIDSYTDGVPTIGSQLVVTIESRTLRPMEGVIWRGLVTFTAEEAT